jgi:hypothetical protein
VWGAVEGKNVVLDLALKGKLHVADFFGGVADFFKISEGLFPNHYE